MFELDRFQQEENELFDFFGLNPPTEMYKIIDNRNFYWSVEERGQHYFIKYTSKDPDNRCLGTDFIHRFRKGKGGYYEKDGVVMFRVTYAIKEVDYSYFRILLNENYIDDYENFTERIPVAAAQL